MSASAEHEHTPSAIATRLASGTKQSYLGDAVLGAMDGTVTTYALVCAISGAGLSAGAAAGVGLAKLLADGLSMAIGNYSRAMADQEVVDKVRRMEEDHIDQIPEGEREEVRQIFRNKGFEGGILERIVETITKDRKRWIDTMLTEEWGLRLDTPKPHQAAWVTFAAFVAAGSVPLIPLFFALGAAASRAYTLSSAATAVTFFAIGYLKGKTLHASPIRGGMETLLLGCVTAALAYGIGRLTQGWV